MCGSSKPRFAALFVPFVLLAGWCASAHNDNPPIRYLSPAAVFDAFREAREKRDWHKVFFYLTPDGQKDALFEAYFACGMHESARELAIQKKYGLDNATLTRAVKNEFKAKRGIYPDDDAKLDEFLNKEYSDDAAKAGGVENANEPGPVPRSVMCNFFAAYVKDQAGFFADVAKLSDDRPVSPLGDLESVIIRADTATGHAKLTYVPTPGESPPLVNPSDKTFRFRKIDGGWLLESL